MKLDVFLRANNLTFRESITRRLGPVLLLAVSCVATGCSKDGGGNKQEHLERGNGYFRQAQYKEAIVEYRNAIKVDPKFGEARFKLADAYVRIGEPKSAYGEAVRAADLLPDNIEAQIQAVTLQLRAGRFEDARTRAEAAVAQHPDNVTIRILLGNSLARLKHLDEALSEVQDAINLDPASPAAHTAFAFLSAAQGDPEAAEAAFKKAAEVAPQSPDAHLAQANYYWSTKRIAEAEAAIKRVLEIDGNHVVANQSLATMYITSGRHSEAVPYLKKLSDIVKDSASRLALADLYIADRQTTDAMAILEVVAADPRAFAAAKGRIASIEYSTDKKDQARATLAEALGKEPHNGDLLVFKSRLLLADGKAAEALQVAQSAVKWNPELASAHYVTGLILALQRDADAAQAAFEEVLKLKPRSVPAQMALAQLNLQGNRPEKTAQLAREALHTQPESAGAHLVLAKALIADAHFDQAASELAPLLTKYPNGGEVHATAGALAYARRDLPAARQHFERALTLAPGLAEAFNGMVVVDLAEGHVAQAGARIASRLKERPTDAQLWLLTSRVAFASRDLAGAERALRKAIEVDSSSLEAYSALAGLYVEQRKLDQAKVELGRLAAQQPNAIGPKTLIAMILELQQQPSEARKLYESVLAIDPTAPVAANNLAWMHAQEGDDLGRALQLARVAATALRNTPEVTDTLGWVYFKMGLVSDAIPQFEQSVEKSPNVPDFRYHLGMAHLQQGDWDKARQLLSKALQMNPRFEGAEEAKRALKSIAE